MSLKFQVAARLNNHVSVSVFIDDKNCGNLCMKKQDFQELCDGMKKLYPDFEIKDE